MKICIATSSGFQVRYILQTQILKRLLSQNVDLQIIAFPSEVDFIKEITNNNVEVFSEPKRPKKNLIEKYLEYMRFFTRAEYNSTSVEIFKRMHLLGTSPLRRLGVKILFILSRILKYSFLLRKIAVYSEKKFTNYKDYRKLLSKLKPDLVVLSSHGAFGFDRYIAYAAKDEGIKIATVILSWDNVTSQTYPAYYANYVIAWTELMKNDIIKLIDYRADQIIVGGSAYFDHYYNNKFSNDNKLNFFQEHNLDPTKKVIFLATRSPNTYPWHPNVAETIAKAINSNETLSNCQLLIRPHPIHFRKDKNGDIEYQDVLNQYQQLSQKYKNIVINYPAVYRESNAFLMKQKDSTILRDLISYSDVVVNIFSTINIEAAILNIPIINICYEYTQPMYKFNSDNPRFNIFSDARESHNQRIVDSGGVAISYNEMQLIEQLKDYIQNPSTDEHGRRLIANREVGPYRGNAGKAIADIIIGYSNSN